jgi:hypothetical protein
MSQHGQRGSPGPKLTSPSPAEAAHLRPVPASSLGDRLAGRGGRPEGVEHRQGLARNGEEHFTLNDALHGTASRACSSRCPSTPRHSPRCLPRNAALRGRRPAGSAGCPSLPLRSSAARTVPLSCGPMASQSFAHLSSASLRCATGRSTIAMGGWANTGGWHAVVEGQCAIAARWRALAAGWSAVAPERTMIALGQCAFTVAGWANALARCASAAGPGPPAQSRSESTKECYALAADLRQAVGVVLAKSRHDRQHASASRVTLIPSLCVRAPLG